MVRPILSDRCLFCLSVTLVYCRQTVGWINVPLGTEVGLGPGHIVLDGDTDPVRKGHSLPPPRIFGQYPFAAKWLHRSRDSSYQIYSVAILTLLF